jgi:signal peptidase I
MVPTLLVNDHLIVSKLSFGWHVPLTKGRILEFRKPKRGEIVIFVPPSDPQKSFVKRCVGIPGDVVEVKDKIVYINGQASDYQTSYGFLDDAPVDVGPSLVQALGQLNQEHLLAWEGLRQRIKSSSSPMAARALMLDNQEHQWKGPMALGRSIYIVGANAFENHFGARLLDGKAAGHFLTMPRGVPEPYGPVWKNLGNHDWYGPVTLEAGQYWMMGDDRDNSADSRYFGPVPEENLRGTALFRYWPMDRIGLLH